MILETIWTERNKVAENRLAICRECDRFNLKLKQCLECYCFMEYKARIMSTKCPLGKWEAHKE